MKMIEPMAVQAAELTASNIAASGASAWSGPVVYAKDDEVILTGLKGRGYETLFRSLQDNNSGHDPAADDGTWWIEIGATDRFKAFDFKIGDPASKAGQITYSITPATLCNGLAFFGLNAGSIRVQVFDDGAPAVQIFDQTVDLVDTTEVVDWFSWAFGDVLYDTEAVLVGVPAYTGYRVDISIDAASGNAEVGQIVIGQLHELGISMDGTSIGIEDYSIKERDEFGSARIVERAFIDTTSFQIAINTGDARRIKRILARNRASPAVYFVGESPEVIGLGATVFGFFADFDIPLSTSGTSYATLEIEGLV